MKENKNTSPPPTLQQEYKQNISVMSFSKLAPNQFCLSKKQNFEIPAELFSMCK